MALREGEPTGMEKLFESSLDTIIQGALDKNAYLELSEQNVLRDCIELNNDLKQEINAKIEIIRDQDFSDNGKPNAPEFVFQFESYELFWLVENIHDIFEETENRRRIVDRLKTNYERENKRLQEIGNALYKVALRQSLGEDECILLFPSTVSAAPYRGKKGKPAEKAKKIAVKPEPQSRNAKRKLLRSLENSSGKASNGFGTRNQFNQSNRGEDENRSELSLNNRELATRLQESLKTNSQLETTIEELRLEIAHLSNALSVSKTKREQERQQLEVLEIENVEISARASTIKATNTIMSEELTKLRTMQNGSNRTIENLRIKLKRKDRELNDKDELLSKKNAQIKGKNKEIDDLKLKLRDREQQIRSLKSTTTPTSAATATTTNTSVEQTQIVNQEQDHKNSSSSEESEILPVKEEKSVKRVKNGWHTFVENMELVGTASMHQCADFTEPEDLEGIRQVEVALGDRWQQMIEDQQIPVFKP